jgi:uncharacterized protein YcfJ
MFDSLKPCSPRPGREFRFLCAAASVATVAWIGLSGSAAFAQQDVAYVVGRQPNFVTVTQQQCHQAPVQVSTTSSNMGGTIVGGVLGAAVGSQIGRGDGKTVATAVGAVLGSQLGGQQATAAPTVEYRTICNQVPVQVQQGETVTFEYRGRRFSQLFP